MLARLIPPPPTGTRSFLFLLTDGEHSVPLERLTLHIVYAAAGRNTQAGLELTSAQPLAPDPPTLGIWHAERACVKSSIFSFCFIEGSLGLSRGHHGAIACSSQSQLSGGPRTKRWFRRGLLVGQ